MKSLGIFRLAGILLPTEERRPITTSSPDVRRGAVVSMGRSPRWAGLARLPYKTVCKRIPASLIATISIPAFS